MATNKKVIMTIALLGALSAFVAFATIAAITPVGNNGYGQQNAYAMEDSYPNKCGCIYIGGGVSSDVTL